MGLDYAKARYYAGAYGRFTSADPLIASAGSGIPQSWNRYSYALNNPLKFIGPTGLQSGAHIAPPAPVIERSQIDFPTVQLDEVFAQAMCEDMVLQLVSEETREIPTSTFDRWLNQGHPNTETVTVATQPLSDYIQNVARAYCRFEVLEYAASQGFSIARVAVPPPNDPVGAFIADGVESLRKREVSIDNSIKEALASRKDKSSLFAEEGNSAKGSREWNLLRRFS